MLLGQRYDRSHCCICDIKKDLEPETSSLWRPEEGERDFCFLCGAVSDTEVCFVSEWTRLTPHTSHPGSEGGRKIRNWTQTLTHWSQLSHREPADIGTLHWVSPSPPHPNIGYHYTDETEKQTEVNLAISLIWVLRLKELHNCFQWLDRNKPRTWIFWER